MKKSIICCNCGKKGHIYRTCKYPKTSLGIISFVKNKNKRKYLMVRRKYSHGYVEFLRGKFKLTNIIFLKKIINEMTNREKNMLLEKDFIVLWSHIWNNPDLTTYTQKQLKEYMTMKYKFIKLKKGWIVNNELFTLDKLIKESPTNWIEPEWGFPKGKRKIKENDINCAIREFEEETGLVKDNYTVYNNILPFIELFVGSDNIQYKTIYYIAKLNINYKKIFTIDKNNKDQYYEISKLGCYSYKKCLELIRPYNIEKIKILSLIHNMKVL